MVKTLQIQIPEIKKKIDIDNYISFLKNVRKKNSDKLLPSTIERYCEFLNRHIDNIHKFNDFESLLNYMNFQVKQSRSIVLYSAFRNYLKCIDIEEEDVLNLLKTPQHNISALTSKRFLQSKVLSKEELKMIFSYTHNEMNKLLISMLYDTACRRDEIMKVRVCDIIIRTEEKDINNGIFASLKVTGKGMKKREVYLSNTTMELYKNYINNNGIKDKDKVFVFRKKDGSVCLCQNDMLYKRMRKIGKQILQRHLHPHMFRHTKITHMADEGADILSLAAYAGHEKPSTTQIYVEISSHRAYYAFAEYSKDISTM